MMASSTGIAPAALVVTLFVEANYCGLGSDAIFFEKGTFDGANPMFAPLDVCRFQQNFVVCQVEVTVK